MEFAAESIHMKELLNKVAARFANRTKSAAFNAWTHFTIVACARRSALTGSRTFRGAATCGWGGSSGEAYHDRQQLRNAVQAMLKSGLVRALRTWRENVDEILNQRDIHEVAARCRTRLAGAFSTWAMRCKRSNTRWRSPLRLSAAHTASSPPLRAVRSLWSLPRGQGSDPTRTHVLHQEVCARRLAALEGDD